MRLHTASSVITLVAIGVTNLQTDAFTPRHHRNLAGLSTQTRRFVSSELETEVEEAVDTVDSPLVDRSKIPQTLRISGKGIPTRKDKIQLLDATTYESSLIDSWEVDPDRQRGFDWEVEKARRWFAGLRMREDGTWVKKPSFFEFLISKHRVSSLSPDAPSAVGPIDTAMLYLINILSMVGMGEALGVSEVPTAVIQKYEGSFLSFIKGILGGDLQTLAGGPLFLLLHKYFKDYGPIFNLSFGPKSFLVISDPVMARHVLKNSSTDQYCKGMLAEILEPIMGKGLIPADPATWRVRHLDRINICFAYGNGLMCANWDCQLLACTFLLL